MQRVGAYYIEPKEEKIIIAKRYFPADELEKLKIAKVRCHGNQYFSDITQAVRIQTFIRGWLARKRAGKLKYIADEKNRFLYEQVKFQSCFLC